MPFREGPRGLRGGAPVRRPSREPVILSVVHAWREIASIGF